MILAVILLVGCALWALGEAIMLTGDQITVLGGTIATIGMTLAGAGIWTLKDLPGMARSGRVGIALSAFGAFSFAMVMIIVLTSGVLGALADGAVHHADIVFTPFYLLALVFVVAGMTAFAIHFRSAPGAPAVAALVPAGLAAGHLVRLFAADVPAYHETLSVALALYLGWLGVRRVALARSAPRPTAGGGV
ncbi:hypothetical protein [Pelagibacterium halotolerans]|uniref:DUF998 domain-containing protein n=1 Tax=Pelagibacterium halotolerans (strain DSM 22347 / JCM 15775 / CGMCC 1.7692 / B2) TaxID=1082931 RepID=G4R6V8_PELHB|nr:hypothetical protein [Pelagibacterium halotolerans]AEQ53231.1 hypothetical protein KKY_3243 [Pelagibacterium halotolerans B2]QJR17138.1 hypothetical protein HKM20_00865 [Pelagibacterium halotolerans]SEA96321.1 hypothetical protein SAMN05428936_11522 [Pelagibacterium halotolerans]